MSWIPKKSTTAMGWGAPAQIATPVATLMTPRSAVCSLEMPVVMSVRRLPAPVYGTLMDINAQSARVRSLVLMERGTEVEFDLALLRNAPIALSGRVEARRNANSGARFEYHLSFASMAEAQIDALVRVVRDLERRNAASRSIQNSIAQFPRPTKQSAAATAHSPRFRRISVAKATRGAKARSATSRRPASA